MTPFGAAMRRWRSLNGVTQKAMAEAIGVTPAYLSALEHGHRGKPNWEFVQKVILYFNIIWDEAEELQRLADLSDPRVTIDTAGLSPAATAFANRLARRIDALDDAVIAALEAELAKAP